MGRKRRAPPAGPPAETLATEEIVSSYAIACPNCRAKADEQCKDYRGWNKGQCWQRRRAWLERNNPPPPPPPVQLRLPGLD